MRFFDIAAYSVTSSLQCSTLNAALWSRRYAARRDGGHLPAILGAILGVIGQECDLSQHNGAALLSRNPPMRYRCHIVPEHERQSFAMTRSHAVAFASRRSAFGAKGEIASG
jgi:hypothetical protein